MNRDREGCEGWIEQTAEPETILLNRVGSLLVEPDLRVRWLM